jgi:hypothetical protein
MLPISFGGAVPVVAQEKFPVGDSVFTTRIPKLESLMKRDAFLYRTMTINVVAFMNATICRLHVGPLHDQGLRWSIWDEGSSYLGDSSGGRFSINGRFGIIDADGDILMLNIDGRRNGGDEPFADGCCGVDSEEDEKSDEGPHESKSGRSEVARASRQPVAIHRDDVTPIAVNHVMPD